MVAWEEPYIGEESIIFPPAARKAPMTAVHSSRSWVSLPTLNVAQLPRPTAGMRSPVDGMGFMSGAGASARRNRGFSAIPAAPAARACTMVRRDGCRSCVMESVPRQRRPGGLGAWRAGCLGARDSSVPLSGAQALDDRRDVQGGGVEHRQASDLR